MSSLQKEQNIVLFESSTNLKNIEKFISKNNSLIITFDYKSHEILTLRRIPHEVSDSFLDEKDIHFLQKETYKLTKWFETEISDSITYENINLGELFYIDFYFILLPVMKKFFEITRIAKKYPNAKFFASSAHYDMIKDCMTQDHQINIIEPELISSIIADVKPQFIFHLAAQTLVLESYQNPLFI